MLMIVPPIEFESPTHLTQSARSCQTLMPKYVQMHQRARWKRSAMRCQRKVEMSGFSPDRNVRFHGFLQGWFAGTWYLGLILFLGLGVCSASPGGRRPEGLADGRTGSGQARRCR